MDRSAGRSLLAPLDGSAASLEKFPHEERELTFKAQMPTTSPNGQEPGKLSGEIGAFGLARHLSMPCELTHVRGTVLAARDFLASQGVENDDLLACELALVEACNNAIRYAAETR